MFRAHPWKTQTQYQTTPYSHTELWLLPTSGHAGLTADTEGMRGMSQGCLHRYSQEGHFLNTVYGPYMGIDT